MRAVGVDEFGQLMAVGVDELVSLKHWVLMSLVS